MTQPQPPPGHDLADLSDRISPDGAAAAADRLRSIAWTTAPDRSSLRRDRLIAWADALDATADKLTAATPKEAAAAADRLRAIGEREQASRGDDPRAVGWADALTAAASVILELPR